jgi:hypothetical protein
MWKFPMQISNHQPNFTTKHRLVEFPKAPEILRSHTQQLLLNVPGLSKRGIPQKVKVNSFAHLLNSFC